MSDSRKIESKPSWTVQVNSLECVWIEDAQGETVCDFYHRVDNPGITRPDRKRDFFVKSNAYENAKKIVDAFDRVSALEAENARLREALRRSLFFAEAVSTGREDGDDYAASDLARGLRALLEGGE